MYTSSSSSKGKRLFEVLQDEPIINVPLKRSKHNENPEFVDLKDRIKLIVHSFYDIHKIEADDIALIFKYREQAEKLGNWVDVSPDGSSIDEKGRIHTKL